MDKIIILDFGGQYCHLIARRIRDFGIYAEVLPASTSKEKLLQISDIKGIIFSGGAASVYGVSSTQCDREIFSLEIPILGICYGHQLLAHLEGGEVQGGNKAEYGITNIKINNKSVLFEGLNDSEKAWMNHRDTVVKLPEDYVITASTANSSVAAFESPQKKLYGVQFHPEVSHTESGDKILENFALRICRAKPEWKASNVIEDIYEEIKRTIGQRKAIIGLSGGVDSSTAAILVSKVIRNNLTAVYVDTGLMRHEETKFIERVFSQYAINLRIVKAQDKFFNALKNITDPEEKRKKIGKLFVDIFEEEALQENAKVLIQGTIYSDRIESGSSQHSSKIKSHHNVGGLPEKLNIEIYEPLRELYKDEVRNIAKDIGLDREIIERHVFPGPGLAVRIIGEVTRERASIVRKAGYIVEEELKKSNFYNKVWMAFAVLLPIRSVGIQGDARSYKFPVVIRIVESKDAMTANFSKVPYEVLEVISTRITNEIAEINRVVYDISNKPPSTMEWE